MAPLYTNLENYVEACNALEKVLGQETQEILKVGLLTKIAGNQKKAGNEEACIQATRDAYELIKRL